MMTLPLNFTPKVFTASPQLETYQSDIIKAAASGSDGMFLNSSVSHAALVLSTMFKYAKNKVLIYGDTLRQELSSLDIYVDSLRNFIQRGGELQVLLTGQPETFSPLVNWLIGLKNVPNVAVLHRADADVAVSKSITNGDETKHYHFAVADGKMYRLEYNIRDYKASASFNYPPMAQLLEKAFIQASSAAEVL